MSYQNSLVRITKKTAVAFKNSTFAFLLATTLTVGGVFSAPLLASPQPLGVLKTNQYVIHLLTDNSQAKYAVFDHDSNLILSPSTEEELVAKLPELHGIITEGTAVKDASLGPEKSPLFEQQ